MKQFLNYLKFCIDSILMNRMIRRYKALPFCKATDCLCSSIFMYRSSKILLISILALSAIACIKEINLTDGNIVKDTPVYLYPFADEAKNVTAEIIIKTNKPVSSDYPEAEIPCLKYNKSWLFMLTQDDCKHAAFSWTWASINGKPLADKFYYNAGQLLWGDLPPDIWYLNKTLGYTDGADNEIRFAPTTTLVPDHDEMNENTEIILHSEKITAGSI